VLEGSPVGTIFASKLQFNGNSAAEDGGAIYMCARGVGMGEA
jgi:predicted outer membrane repeat protein